MADKSLDRDTRRIDQARVQKGKELEMMQQAQNQFLAIQAERKQNLTDKLAIKYKWIHYSKKTRLQ